MLTLHLATGGSVLVYPKDDHEPAEFTVLNFPVDDIDVAVAKLKVANVPFESYEGDMSTDDHNIARGIERNMGPDIAWFREPRLRPGPPLAKLGSPRTPAAGPCRGIIDGGT